MTKEIYLETLKSVLGRSILHYLLGGNLTKIVTFGTKRFVCYPMYVCYLGCPLLPLSKGSTVFILAVWNFS